MLSVAAYAYEFESEIIMSDADFDKLSLQVDLLVSTGNTKLDRFFRTEFEPDTGMWIRSHPELRKVKELYLRLKQRGTYIEII